MTQLEIGKNYGPIFGLDAKQGEKMIYNGNDSWTGINGDQQQTIDDPETTAEAIKYIYLMPDYKRDDIEIVGNIGYKVKGGR